MPVEPLIDKYSGAINTVEIGGFGSKTVKVGGETGMPFLFNEGAMPNPPLVAMEVIDVVPEDMPDCVRDIFGPSIEDPVKWAAACVDRYKARALCVRLQGLHPDYGARSADEEVSILRGIARETGVPLIVVGCGDDEKDNNAIPKLSQAMKGDNCLFGIATQANYKTLAATCLADGHSLIAESPIDINIAKQVNILISDMGFDPARIVMHPTTTSLGYGMEYVYSIMERGRLAAFIGDRMLAMPFIVFVGQETWKVKEAKESAHQGINWELTTAVSMIQSGADIVVMRHPASAQSVGKYIDSIMKR
jgi:acetyl-CoA decarbonylase/synthase complex subunit delta